MRNWLLLTALAIGGFFALAAAAEAQALTKAPRLTAVTGTPTFIVPAREWVWPEWDAFYLNREPDDQYQGIYLRPKIFRPLVHALNDGWPKTYRGRLDLAYSVFVLGHEWFHSQEGPYWDDQERASFYAERFDVFNHISARLGLGPYHRRALFSIFYGGEAAP